jgi:alkylation response protein AidB-like acyl-CoA dehydrogenase
MDRANAIRLLEALMAGGKYSGTPMAKAWVTKKAWEIGLECQELASALGYAGNEGWLADAPREGQILLTSKGETIMRNLARRTRRR